MNRSIPLPAVFSLLLLSLASTACKSYPTCKGPITVENRRDLYLPQTVWGPYTSMLYHGIPSPTPLQGGAAPDQSDNGKDVVAPQNPPN